MSPISDKCLKLDGRFASPIGLKLVQYNLYSYRAAEGKCSQIGSYTTLIDTTIAVYQLL